MKWRCQVFKGEGIIIIVFYIIIVSLDFTKWSVTAAYWNGGKFNVAYFGICKYYWVQDSYCGAWKGIPWSPCYNIIKVLLAISSDHLHITARDSCPPSKCNFLNFFLSVICYFKDWEQRHVPFPQICLNFWLLPWLKVASLVGKEVGRTSNCAIAVETAGSRDVIVLPLYW